MINEENVEDLEDLQNRRVQSLDGRNPIVRSYEQRTGKAMNRPNSMQCKMDSVGSLEKQSSTLQKDFMASENIDKNVDYQGWLDLKKRKWKETLEKRKRQR